MIDTGPGKMGRKGRERQLLLAKSLRELGVLELAEAVEAEPSRAPHTTPSPAPHLHVLMHPFHGGEVRLRL